MADMRVVSMACDGAAVHPAVEKVAGQEGGILDLEMPR